MSLSEVTRYWDNIEQIRGTTLFEWTFAILVLNLTIQVYRLAANLIIIIFDLFKLTYSVDLFWPLTNEDRKTYSLYFVQQRDVIFKLIEGIILVVAAFFGASGLLTFSISNLIVYTSVFIAHGIILTLGATFIQGKSMLFT